MPRLQSKPGPSGVLGDSSTEEGKIKQFKMDICAGRGMFKGT